MMSEGRSPDCVAAFGGVAVADRGRPINKARR
jgi:hypothetical protein